MMAAANIALPVASIVGLRQALEGTRYGWLTLGLAAAVIAPFLLDEAGLILGAIIVGIAVLMAAEMSRPLRPTNDQDRAVAVVLYVLLMGPVAIAASALAWVAFFGGEIAIDFEGRVNKDMTLAWGIGPSAVGVFLAASVLVPRRGTRRNVKAYWLSLSLGLAIGWLWDAFIWSPVMDVPGGLFMALGAMGAFGVLLLRVYHPYRAPRHRSMHLYEASPASASGNQADRTGPSVVRDKR